MDASRKRGNIQCVLYLYLLCGGNSMIKCFNFFKLLKYLWDNSDKIFRLLTNAQEKLPILVNALNTSADALMVGSNLIGFIEGEVGNTFKKVGGTLENIKIPKLEVTTSGFMDVLLDALRKVLTVSIIQPSQEIRDNFNKIRVLDKPELDKQITPFQEFSTFFDLEGQIIVGKSELSKEAIENTAKGLKEIALLLEGIEQ